MLNRPVICCARLGGAAVPLLMLAACGQPILSAGDVITRDDDRAVRLVAFVEREGALGLRSGVAGVRVSFALDGRAEAAAATDGDGVASVDCPVSAGTRFRGFKARAVVEGRELVANGRIYRWRSDRTIIAVDIDDTISDTEYEELLLEKRDTDSDPLSGSRRALESLAEDFQILYLTARPRGLRDKTRQWLAEHKFPDGPLIVSRRTVDVIAQEDYRRRTLAELRARWPNLLIGIGNRAADARAQADNGMLSVLIREERPAGPLPPNTLVFEKWKHARRFFESYRRDLADPPRLGKHLRDGRVARWAAARAEH